MAQDVSLDEFLTGLFAALVERGVTSVSVRGESFYRAVEAAYQRLEDDQADYNVDPRFVILIDPIYTDCPTVREAIGSLMVRNVAWISGLVYDDLHLRIRYDEAQALLNYLPGGDSLYSELADTFLQSYRPSAMTAAE